MRKIAIIICICLLTISVGLLDVHNGNLDGFLLMLVVFKWNNMYVVRVKTLTTKI